MANQYKSFQKGFSLIPKAATLDGPYNTTKGDIELLTSTNKLYFHNGTINDPIVQENVAATLANKTLTAPVINNSTADTITGIAGGPLLIQSASNQNTTLQSLGTGDLNLLAAGTGKVFLEGFTVDGTNIKNTLTGNITVNADGGNTFFQVTGTNIVRIDSDGIAFLNQKDARFYDSDNSNYVGIDAPSTVPVDYTITLPSAGPTANTALVYDGTQYKWGAAGGADSAGANDDILATAFRARILDSFDDAPTLSSSTINSATTTATHVPANQLYAIQYDATQTLSGGGTTYSLGAQPSFTLAVGDVLVAGTEVRRITVLGSPNAWVNFTIESAFVGSPSGACIVSQTVSSKELYGSTFDGDSIADAFSNTDFSEYLIDYQDSTTTIYETSIAPKVSYSVSQDGTTWSDLASRPQYQTDQIQSGSFATADNALYVRLFANTTGSGTVNLLEYRAYMQKSPSVASGILNAAYAKFDGSISPQNCTVATVLGKTQVTLSWPYTKDVNNPSAFGSIDVYINGQFIPRQVGTYLPTSSWAFYKEITQNIIELDSDYSSSPYAIQIVQRQPIGNFTSSTGGSSSSSGDGLKNYLTTYLNNSGNGNFEVGDTSGWSLFNTTLTSKVPTGSITAGAASITTFTTTASTPLAGSFSLSVGSSGVLSAGQGFITNAFTIDREDRAKVLTFNFSYEAVSGTMDFSGSSNNTWAIYLYDGTNWIQPAGVYSMVQSSGVGYASGTFQTNSTATSYRLAVICITATGGAVSLKFDDFFVGPQVSVNAPAMSDWQSYTPSGSWVANTTYTGRWRRVGDTVEVDVGLSLTGAPTATTLTVNYLPPGLSLDTSKMSLAQNFIRSGYADGQAGGTAYNLKPIWNNSTSVILAYQNTTSGSETGVTNTVPVSWNSTHNIHMRLSVPIAGWSSNTVASADTDTRVVDLVVNDATSILPTGTIASTFSSSTTVNWNRTPVKDSHGTYSTGSYTVPVSGDYFVTSSAEISHTASTGTYVGGYIMVNGAVRLADARKPTSPNAYVSVNGLIANLKAGDIITVRYASDATSPAFINSIVNNFTVSRISGPAVVQATETVAASYYASANGTSSTTSPINFDTREYDTHNAVTASPPGSGAWRFTAPVSGTYSITAFSNASVGTAAYFFVYKNSTTTAYKPFGYCSISITLNSTALLKLNAGDFIGIYSSVSFPYYGNASLANQNISHISILRVGN